MVLRTIRSHAIARLTPSCALRPLGLTSIRSQDNRDLGSGALEAVIGRERRVGRWSVIGRKTGGRWSVYDVGPAGLRM